MSEKDKDSFFQALTPRNNIVNFSFNSPNLNKPRITFSNFLNNSNKTFSTILNLEENNYQTEQNQDSAHSDNYYYDPFDGFDEFFKGFRSFGW